MLTINALDHVARNWRLGRWQADRDAMFKVLTQCWVGLLHDSNAEAR